MFAQFNFRYSLHLYFFCWVHEFPSFVTSGRLTRNGFHTFWTQIMFWILSVTTLIMQCISGGDYRFSLCAHSVRGGAPNRYEKIEKIEKNKLRLHFFTFHVSTSLHCSLLCIVVVPSLSAVVWAIQQLEFNSLIMVLSHLFIFNFIFVNLNKCF